MEKITGKDFRGMLESGTNNLSNNASNIDALNVFPVPDGDTGTNMNLTFTSGIKEVQSKPLESVGDIAKVLSRGLLMGARGNSGVILSQIFRGFSQAVAGLEEIDATTFVAALVKGAEIAYKAVMRPVEGTILTVIRESSDATQVRMNQEGTADVNRVVDILVEEAKKSLSTTPDLLPVLKEVGVVDSGGAGLTAVFEGFKAYLDGNPITLAGAETKEEVGTGYDVTFTIVLNKELGVSYDEDHIKKQMSHIGDSLTLNRNGEQVTFAVHTLMPGEVLNVGQKYGEFVDVKIVNNFLGDVKVEEAPKAEAKEFALVAVAAGKGLEDYFKSLRVDLIVSGGQTMNPSTEDFVEAVKKLNAKHVIILPNNSNIVMAANQAADIIEDKDVRVIPTKTIPQGISALTMFNPDSSIDENVENMQDAASNIKTGQVTYAIKDTTFEGLTINANDYMGIKEKDIIVSEPNKMDVTKKLLDAMLDEDSELVTLVVGEGVSEDEAEEIQSYIEDHSDAEVELVQGDQPVYSFFIGVE